MLHPVPPVPFPHTDDLLRVTALPGGDRGRVVVEVVGEIDQQTVPLLEACLHTQTGRRGPRTLVVDLTGVSFFGGTGLAALARARKHCLTRGGRLVVRCAGRRAVLRPLHLAGLASLVEEEAGAADLRDTPGAEERGRVVPPPAGPRSTGC
ncbi:STAS domain-containing protein [Modestobacter lapidis]|nr:STAS domain-containing protein [Modestobacter lapidis]